MVEQIACFLTCGYTEAGAMQAFLKKINDKYEYKQYLPNKTIRKKGSPKTIQNNISGLTGEKLLARIYSILEKHRAEILECKAIIIEDDLDGRFCKYDVAEIQQYNQQIKDKIYEILGQEIPIFILYASPEVETWFLADWENGFEYLYSSRNITQDLETREAKYFCHHLKKYVDEEILREYRTDIEYYGCNDTTFLKLSDKIIDAVQIKVKDYIRNMSGDKPDYVEKILNARTLYYSKKLHGDFMLRNVRPEVIAAKCRRYFVHEYSALHDFKG